MSQHIHPDVEWACQLRLGAQGGNFKSPNVVFLLFEVAAAMFRASSTGWVVAALEDDRVKHDAPSLVVGALRKNAAEEASFEGNLPPVFVWQQTPYV